MGAKSQEAFRTISEAAAEVGVEPHVLRFWETRFAFIRPLRRSGARRYYRPGDIRILNRLRELLHEDGLSIREVQSLPSRDWRDVAAEPRNPSPTFPRSDGSMTVGRGVAGLEAAWARAASAKLALDRLLAASRP